MIGLVRTARGIACALVIVWAFADCQGGAPYSDVVGGTSAWVAVSQRLDVEPGSVLDFSSIGPSHAPAGKFGRIVVRGDHFEFENLPGVRQRFWGVNLSYEANFPAPDEAQRTVRRLAAVGYNAIRIHHHDGALVSGSEDGTTLNPDRIDRLDRLVAECVKAGLYILTDLYVDRPMPFGGSKDELRYNKELLLVNNAAKSNFKKFIWNWLTHVNPYTGHRWADEPALVAVSIVNEGNPGNNKKLVDMRKIPEWGKAWGAKFPEDMTKVEDGEQVLRFSHFLADVEERFDVEMKRFLRDEVGLKAPLSSLSGWQNFPIYQRVRAHVYDYVDDHVYIDHPEGPLRGVFEYPNRELFKLYDHGHPIDNFSTQFGCMSRRLLDKPYVVSEANYCWPSERRNSSALVFGVVARLQGWDGLWRYCWSHRRYDPDTECIRQFNIVNDPMATVGERLAVALFLRGDIPELREKAAVWINPSRANQIVSGDPIACGWRWLGRLCWSYKVGTFWGADLPNDIHELGRYPDAYRWASCCYLTNNMPKIGAVRCVSVDWQTGGLSVSAERVAAASSSAGELSAGPLKVRSSSNPTTVFLVSRDGLPLTESGRLLFAHLTDVRNSAMKVVPAKENTGDSRMRVLDHGTLPHVMRRDRAEVSFESTRGDLKIWAVDTTGARIMQIPAVRCGNALQFTADIACRQEDATFIYEIVAD